MNIILQRWNAYESVEELGYNLMFWMFGILPYHLLHVSQEERNRQIPLQKNTGISVLKGSTGKMGYRTGGSDNNVG